MCLDFVDISLMLASGAEGSIDASTTMVIMSEMGIDYEQAQIALLVTGNHCLEQALELIFQNPDKQWHRFEPDALDSLCMRCSMEKKAHFVNQFGFLIPPSEDMAAELLVPQPMEIDSSEPGSFHLEIEEKKEDVRLRRNDSDSMEDDWNALEPISAEERASRIALMRENALKAVARSRAAIVEEKKIDDSEPKLRCGICFDDLPETAMARATCGHWYCSSCLVQHYSIKVQEANVLHLTCIEPSCNREISDEEFKSFLPSEELLVKYAKFKKNKLMAENPNSRWCPKPGCETALTGSILQPKLTCPTCSTTVCFKCGEPW
jgi:hypothetical protein